MKIKIHKTFIIISEKKMGFVFIKKRIIKDAGILPAQSFLETLQSIVFFLKWKMILIDLVIKEKAKSIATTAINSNWKNIKSRGARVAPPPTPVSPIKIPTRKPKKVKRIGSTPTNQDKN